MPFMSKRVSPRTWLEGKRFHDSDECLNWPFGTRTAGYGVIRMPNGRNLSATRLMCELAHGRPPSDIHQVAHACGNPLCVNPRHLRWATPKENHADMFIHGTDASGEKAPAAKLSVGAVMDIREAAARGVSTRELGRRYGVSHNTAAEAARGKTWRPDRKLLIADKRAHHARVRKAQAASP